MSAFLEIEVKKRLTKPKKEQKKQKSKTKLTERRQHGTRSRVLEPSSANKTPQACQVHCIWISYENQQLCLTIENKHGDGTMKIVFHKIILSM